MRTKCITIVAILVASLPTAGQSQTPYGGAPWSEPVKPTLSQRAGAALKDNPITTSWASLRKKNNKQQSRANTPPYDPISLAHRTPPASPDLLISAAKFSERNGQVDKARQQFHQALTMAPTHVPGLIEFGRLEDRQGQLEQAERHYRTAVNLNPHNPTALNDLALCVARQGKLDESTHLLGRAIEIQPDKALYRNNLATVLVEQQRNQEALVHLAAVHGPAAANYNLGHLLTQRGRPHDAATYFVAALQADPQMTQAATALAALGHPVPRMAATPVQNNAMQPMIQPTEPQGPRFVAPQAQYGPAQSGPQQGYAYQYTQPATPVQAVAQNSPSATQLAPLRGAMRPLPPVGAAGVPVTR